MHAHIQTRTKQTTQGCGFNSEELIHPSNLDVSAHVSKNRPWVPRLEYVVFRLQILSGQSRLLKKCHRDQVLKVCQTISFNLEMQTSQSHLYHVTWFAFLVVPLSGRLLASASISTPWLTELFFLSFFLGFRRPNLIPGLSGWRTPD